MVQVNHNQPGYSSGKLDALNLPRFLRLGEHQKESFARFARDGATVSFRFSSQPAKRRLAAAGGGARGRGAGEGEGKEKRAGGIFSMPGPSRCFAVLVAGRRSGSSPRCPYPPPALQIIYPGMIFRASGNFGRKSRNRGHFPTSKIIFPFVYRHSMRSDPPFLPFKWVHLTPLLAWFTLLCFDLQPFTTTKWGSGLYFKNLRKKGHI